MSLLERLEVPLEVSPLVLDIFKDGQERFGSRAWSSMIVKRLEEACGIELRAPGFPEEIEDDEPEDEAAVEQPVAVQQQPNQQQPPVQEPAEEEPVAEPRHRPATHL